MVKDEHDCGKLHGKVQSSNLKNGKPENQKPRTQIKATK